MYVFHPPLHPPTHRICTICRVLSCKVHLKGFSTYLNNVRGGVVVLGGGNGPVRRVVGRLVVLDVVGGGAGGGRRRRRQVVERRRRELQILLEAVYAGEVCKINVY